MDWRDIAPVIVGILVLTGIAVFIHPTEKPVSGSPAELTPAPSEEPSLPAGETNATSGKIPIQVLFTPQPVTTSSEEATGEYQTAIPVQVLLTPGTTPVPTPSLPQIQPYRIFYTDNPMAYPRIRLPDNMVPYGASDIPQQPWNNVEFAYLEESRGGLTQTFTVPYPFWVINVTVISKTNPNYAHFRMLLCDAKTGDIYEGGELYYPGTIYKNIQVSGRPMYLIIATDYVDRYHMNFETPAENIVSRAS